MGRRSDAIVRDTPEIFSSKCPFRPCGSRPCTRLPRGGELSLRTLVVNDIAEIAQHPHSSGVAPTLSPYSVTRGPDHDQGSGWQLDRLRAVEGLDTGALTQHGDGLGASPSVTAGQPVRQRRLDEGRG